MTRPPGILLLAAGYGAGLATGLSHLMNPLLVALLLILLAIAVGREWWFPFFPALCAGLAFGAHARVVAQTSCASVLPLGEQTYRVRSIDPGEGTGRIGFVGRTCEGSVLAGWPRSTRVLAGVTLTVTARWIPAERPLRRPDGMLHISAVDSMRVRPGAVERLRNSIVASTRVLYGPRAPLANALLAGWRGELDPELRAAFASAGLMHLLAISGLHVALIAGWILLILRLARVPRHPAEVAAALAGLLYAGFLGWPSAAMRAALLLLLAAVCRWRQRQVRFSALLGASVLLVLIVDPWAVAEPGLWLSIAGLSGVVAAGRWTARALGSAWWLQGMAGSMGAVIATAPIAAAVFGQVAPVGILLNVVAMPLLVALLPTLVAAVVLRPFLPTIAVAFGASGNGLLALLEGVAQAGSLAPGSAVPSQAGWSAALPWIALQLAAAWATWRHTTLAEAMRRIAWCTVIALAVNLVMSRRPTGASGDQLLTIRFVDVGQGDAALIRTPLGHWLEVDAGPVGEGRDAGRRVIAPLLAREGVRRIDLFVLSHAHRDHVGGAPSVLAKVPTDLAVEPGELFADSAYENWLAALGEHRTRWRAARSGAAWVIDGVTFRILHPPSPWPHQGEDLNEDSIVLEITYGEFRALLMGDAGFVAESALAGKLGVVNVLKVGHHGSRTASGAEFLASIRPQVAVISVGRNTYGHPSPETLARLITAGAIAWRTDMEGTVSVTTDGHMFDVKGARSSATFGARH